MNSGYHAIRESCAWVDLSRRGKILVRGEDRARLLHAMTTNHVQDLAYGQGCYAFFLNDKGRILGDVELFRLPEYFLMDTEPETKQRLFQHLDQYIIADDVTLEDATAQMATLTLEGPDAEQVLRKLGAPVPEQPYQCSLWDTEIVARKSAVGGSGFRIFTPVAEKTEVVLALEEARVVEADESTLRTVRLENGIPRYGEDFSDANLAQEPGLQQALHFQKGCYLGQEIVERVRSRGHLNKRLVPLVFETELPLDPGAKIALDGKEVGEVTSSVYSPALQQVIGLGYLRVEAARPGVALRSQDVPLTVREVTGQQ